MNKQLLINIGMLAIGATAGALVTKKMLEKKYFEQAQEEIDSVREMYERRLVEQKKQTETVEGAYTTLIQTPVRTKSSLDGTKTNVYEQAKINYNLIRYKDGEMSQGEDDDEEDPNGGEIVDAAGMSEEDMAVPQIDRTEPYLIDDDQFSEECDYHDKISLYYYRVDGVLCDESEEIIDNIDGTVGEEALNLLDTEVSVWIRNERIRIDYEIIALNQSYAETVHGIGLESAFTPREKYLRKMGRENEND